MTPVSVLLVDDSARFLQVTTRFLQLRSHDRVRVAGTAAGGREGLLKAGELKPQVILLDLCMPDLGGLELIPMLRAMFPDIGIVALTLLDMEAYRRAATTSGVDEFVSKANLETELLPAIRRAAKAHRKDAETELRDRARLVGRTPARSPSGNSLNA